VPRLGPAGPLVASLAERGGVRLFHSLFFKATLVGTASLRPYRRKALLSSDISHANTTERGPWSQRPLSLQQSLKSAFEGSMGGGGGEEKRCGPLSSWLLSPESSSKLGRGIRRRAEEAGVLGRKKGVHTSGIACVVQGCGEMFTVGRGALDRANGGRKRGGEACNAALRDFRVEYTLYNTTSSSSTSSS
jgi:hypothetical protein